MDYPQDWKMKEPEANNMNIVVGFLAPGEDMANPSNYVIIQVENLPATQTITLDQYGQAVMTNLKKTYPDFNLISTDNIDISNNPAKELVYTLSINQAPYKETLAYTIQNNKAYLISYYASPDRYPEFEGVVEKMIGSFNFISPVNNPTPITPSFADRFVVSVTDSENNVISGALVEISACSLTTSCTTTSTKTCTFDVQNSCNDINVYVNGNLKWSGKFQPRVNIIV